MTTSCGCYGDFLSKFHETTNTFNIFNFTYFLRHSFSRIEIPIRKKEKEKKQDYNIYIVYRLYFLLNLTCKTLTKLPEIEHRFLDPLKVCKTHFNFLIFIS